MFNIALICLYGVENNGIRTISSVLREAGFNPAIIFFKRWINNDISLPTQAEKDMLISLIEKLEVGLIGISFTSPFLKIAQDLTSRIKNTVKAPVVWGGVHATAQPAECLAYCDIVCRGEGEYAMLDLTKAYARGDPSKAVKNTCSMRDGRVIFGDMRPLVQDLDSLPCQDYGGNNKFFIENGLYNIDPLAYARELRVFASRGCPFNCSYCYNSILRKLYKEEPYHRIRSAESVLTEIEQALSKFKNIKKIKFDDDTFVFPRQWMDEFCTKYRSRIGLPFEILLNAECADKEAIGKLKTAGLKRVQIGVQTGSPLESDGVYNRSLCLEKIRQAADAAKGLRVGVVYDVILDNPLATPEDKQSLIFFLLSLPRPFDLFIYSLTVFPGTALCELFLKRGLIDDSGVEGSANKSFYQFRLSFSYPRKKEELFIACIVSLISKSFIPKPLISWFNKSGFLKRHPLPLKWFALACNSLKLLFIFIRMSFEGEMSVWKLSEYGSPKRSLIQ